MTYKVNKYIIIIVLLIVSCNRDIIIYDINDDKCKLINIEEEYILILGNIFCKDCMINLINYFNNEHKNYIVVYSNYKFNNLVKITMNEMLKSYGVDSSSIYWINKEYYDENFKRYKTPFLFVMNESNNIKIIKYNRIFNKYGYIIKDFIKKF
jgi:hypothetical protein